MFAEIINPDEIRVLVRDNPDLNVLLSYEEQFEDDEIYTAAENAEEEVFARFPALRGKPIPKIIINYMVLSYLLRAISAQELRNQMQINDDNVGAIDYSNKFPQYNQFAAQYKSEAMQMLHSLAANNFYNNFWGSVSSNSFDIEH